MFPDGSPSVSTFNIQNGNFRSCGELLAVLLALVAVREIISLRNAACREIPGKRDTLPKAKINVMFFQSTLYPLCTVETSDRSLRLYGKALLPIKGICELKVTNPKTQTEYTVKFIIGKGDYVPLLGADAVQKMSLLTVKYANILGANDDNARTGAASSSPSLQTQQGAIPDTVMSAASLMICL
eukprot:gene17172-18897_t